MVLGALEACAPSACASCTPSFPVPPSGLFQRRPFSSSEASANSSAATRRIPSSIPEEFVKYLPVSKWDLPAALQPTMVDGVLKPAKISGLLRSKIRKAALLSMASGDSTNAWNHEWDRQLAARVMKPPKKTIGKDAKVAERSVQSLTKNLAMLYATPQKCFQGSIFGGGVVG